MAELDLPQDFSDLLAELLEAKVQFVVIGGWVVVATLTGYADRIR